MHDNVFYKSWDRIKNVLNYKKPVFWVVVVSLVVVLILSAGLLTNPKAEVDQHQSEDESFPSMEYLWKARTKYVGDNSAVGKIIGLLQFPEGLIYDGFELHTKEHPYAVTINFKTDTETRNFYTAADNQYPFQLNALVMLSLIENAEYITFGLDDGVYDPYSLQYTRGMVKNILGDDYFKGSETLDGFRSQIEKLKESVITNTVEAIIIQYSSTKIIKGIEMAQLSPIDEQLVEAIIMDYIFKSSVWKGVDINNLEECYLIRQTFPEINEVHDFYAYQLDDGKTVLQADTDGFYAELSSELYIRLAETFE